MTFLFAAGIATVILPIAMGASVLRQLLTTQHTTIYVTGGVLAFAIYVLLGGHLHLPMPGRRARGKTGVVGVYSLGIFSGMASSCCAPVLAGEKGPKTDMCTLSRGQKTAQPVEKRLY